MPFDRIDFTARAAAYRAKAKKFREIAVALPPGDQRDENRLLASGYDNLADECEIIAKSEATSSLETG